MKGIVLDCAVAGSWNFREPWDSPKQGKCVRVAWQAFGPTGVYEEGCLIAIPDDATICTGENLERGGISRAGLEREGFVGTGQRESSFWNQLEQAEIVVTFAQDFHLGALKGFAASQGVIMDDFRRPQFADVMVLATPLVKIPNKGGKRGYSFPPMDKAYDALVRDNGPLAAKRRDAITCPEPVRAFGLVQVRAVGAIYRAIRKPREPDAASFSM